MVWEVDCVVGILVNTKKMLIAAKINAGFRLIGQLFPMAAKKNNDISDFPNVMVSNVNLFDYKHNCRKLFLI